MKPLPGTTSSHSPEDLLRLCRWAARRVTRGLRWVDDSYLDDVCQETVTICLELHATGLEHVNVRFAAWEALRREHKRWSRAVPEYKVSQVLSWEPAYDRQVDGALCIERLRSLYPTLSEIEQSAILLILSDDAERVDAIARATRRHRVDLIAARNRVLRRLRAEMGVS